MTDVMKATAAEVCYKHQHHALSSSRSTSGGAAEAVTLISTETGKLYIVPILEVISCMHRFNNNNNNNNNNNRDDIYGAVIMAKPLLEFTRFI